MTSAADQIKLVFDKRELLNVDYLEAKDISIGVENGNPKAAMVVESVALRFKSRRSITGTDRADPHTTVVYPGAAFSIAPTKLGYCTVRVRPNLLFLGYTNYFDVAITYRFNAETIGEPQDFIDQGWFVLVKPAPQIFGNVFISYKEPEDRPLADLLFGFAKDAGFVPYMAPPDIRTGSPIWSKKIPVAITASKFIFVIWTGNAPRGSGVKKEIKIARQNEIEIVPLLERKARDPKLFGRDVEYTRFDVNDAELTFAKVVAARRGM